MSGKSDGHDADRQDRSLGTPCLPAESGPDELQHELVDRQLGTKYDRVARILAMAQEIPFRREPESRCLDFPPQRRLFNTIQGFPDVYSSPLLPPDLRHTPTTPP